MRGGLLHVAQRHSRVERGSDERESECVRRDGFAAARRGGRPYGRSARRHAGPAAAGPPPARHARRGSPAPPARATRPPEASPWSSSAPTPPGITSLSSWPPAPTPTSPNRSAYGPSSRPSTKHSASSPACPARHRPGPRHHQRTRRAPARMMPVAAHPAARRGLSHHRFHAVTIADGGARGRVEPTSTRGAAQLPAQAWRRQQALATRRAAHSSSGQVSMVMPISSTGGSAGSPKVSAHNSTPLTLIRCTRVLCGVGGGWFSETDDLAGQDHRTPVVRRTTDCVCRICPGPFDVM